MGTTEELMLLLNDKINLGENLVVKLEPLNEIDGVTKLQRKIRQEIEFLRKVILTMTMTNVETYLFTNNLLQILL